MTATATSTSVTEAIAQFACDGLPSYPDALYERATRAFVDTIGVAIAARREPSFTILADTLGAAGSTSGEATILPTRRRTDAAQAALLNGTAGHALDYDDVADEIKGHPSVVLVSTLLALAEAQHASGAELLEAFAVGFEVACAVASGIHVERHYLEGWHATATVGILGAVAGAGHLMRLDPLPMQYALGIAASMASGSRQNFGTMTKPLHAGLASRDAVTAARLAANGFTADPHQLEGRIGYFRQYGVEPDPDAVVLALEQPHVLLEHGLNVKKYPCCYGTHRMADAALALQARGLRADEVTQIDVSMEPGGMEPIIHHQPRTGLQGKFSGEYVVAACLLDGRIGLSTFADAAVDRSAAQDLLARVTIAERATPPVGDASFEHAYATLEVRLRDGRVVRERCDIPRGDARAPLGDGEVEAKFRDCLAFGDSPWSADALWPTLRNLRHVPDVAALLS